MRTGQRFDGAEKFAEMTAQLLGTAEEDMEHLQQILMGDVVVLCIK